MAVIKHHCSDYLWRNGIIWLMLLQQSPLERSLGRNSRQKLEWEKWSRSHGGRWLTGLLLSWLNLLSYAAQNQLLRGGITHSRLGLLTWIIKQDNTSIDLTTRLQGNLVSSVFSIKIPTSKICLGLCQVDQDHLSQPVSSDKILKSYSEKLKRLIFSFQAQFGGHLSHLRHSGLYNMTVSHFQCLQLAKHFEDIHNPTDTIQGKWSCFWIILLGSQKCYINVVLSWRFANYRLIWPATCFWVKFYWNTAIHICLYYIYGCFCCMVQRPYEWQSYVSCTVFTENSWRPHVKSRYL
jgi:hypothetical protein